MTNPETLTIEKYQKFLNLRFGGVVQPGKHHPDGEACINESYAVYRGLDWMDDPRVLGLPDLRPLNDAPWRTNAERTEAMVRLLVTYQGWATWTSARRQEVIERLVLLTVQQIIATLPGLSNKIRAQCRAVTTLTQAAAAARAAREVLAGASEVSAWSTDVAVWAARVAREPVLEANATEWIAEAAARASEVVDGGGAILQKTTALWEEAAA